MRPSPLLTRRSLLILALLFSLVWFANLGGRKLQHPDEGRYAEIAREMTISGDWVTPRLNGLKYFEKPALQYWMTAGAFEAFGVSEASARLAPALLGWLSVLAIGCAGARIADGSTGVYSACALGSCVWYAGIAHMVTLDAVLTGWLAMGLAAFLLAQRADISMESSRRWMLAAWCAIALAVLTKGLVGLVIPGGALVLYSAGTRDLAVWRRLHLVAGLALVIAICAPWFVLVSIRNPEFAWFFFVHEHFQRFLTTEAQRVGPWWYFVPLLVVGLIPWVGLFAWKLPAAWRDAPGDANGFSWMRFCLAWSAFVFIFFSASGSKLPSYIGPMFPALALVLGWQLRTLSDGALAALLLLLGALSVLTALGAVAAYDAIVLRFADAQTPLAVYEAFRPWLYAGLSLMGASSLAAFFAARSRLESRRLVALALVGLGALGMLQLLLAGNDAFSVTRSAFALVQSVKAGRYDAGAPFYQVGMYDQTLPFYLARTTTLVDYRDELALGLDAEPDKGIATEGAWRARWEQSSRGYAVMTHDTYDRLRSERIPMREIARDPRRVVVARD